MYETMTVCEAGLDTMSASRSRPSATVLLIGLGDEQLDALQKQGRSTREYAVFGEEHFLYVLNRIAEEPVRPYQAVIDVMRSD